MLGTLALSRGVPMLLAGDELSRTQRGNNNAFCQDNALSWLDWSALDDPARDLRPWVAAALHLRRVLRFARRDAFFTGTSITGSTADRDVRWFEPDGRELDGAAWQDPSQRGLGVLFTSPGGIAEAPERLFLALNPGPDMLAFRLPSPPDTPGWRLALDGGDRRTTAAAVIACGGQISLLPGDLMALLPAT